MTLMFPNEEIILVSFFSWEAFFLSLVWFVCRVTRVGARVQALACSADAP